MINIKHSALMLALASAVVSPLLHAEATVYGKAHISAASLDDDNGSSTAVTSHSSRFGVKGKIDSDNAANVFYKLEWQVDMADKNDSTQIKSRSQYIGLNDSWGEIRLGRDDSPYKKAGKKAVEILSDTYADYNNIVDKGQDTRSNNSMSYSTKIGSGKLSLMYAAGDDSTELDTTVPTNPTGQNSGSATSVSYDMNFDNLRIAIATQSINDVGAADNTETGTKLVLGYKLSKATQMGLLFETVSDDTNTVDDTNTLFSVKHKMGKDVVKFVYGIKDQGAAADATMLALAYDHKLNKSTSVYALYANGADGGLAANSKLDGDATVVAAGMVVKF